MPTDDLNQQLATSWQTLTAMVSQQLAGVMSSSWSDSGITISGLQATWDFAAAPGFAGILSDSEIHLALPLDESGWSFDATFLLSAEVTIGGRIRVINNKPLRINLKSVRATLSAVMDAAGVNAGLPRVRSIEVGATLDLSITAYRDPGSPSLLALSIGENRKQQWTKASSSLLYFDIKNIDLGVLGVPTSVDGRLSYHPLDSSVFRLQIAGVEFDMPLHLPMETLVDIQTAIDADNLPVRWGAQFPNPEPDAGTVDPAINLNTMAIRIGTQLASALPDGSIFDRVYALDNDGNPTGDIKWYAGERDSAIWTGHYLAAEAFHFAAADATGLETERATALDRICVILNSIERLFEVPQAATRKQAEPGEDCQRLLLPLDLMSRRGLLCRAVLPSSQLGLTRISFKTPGVVPTGTGPACENTTDNQPDSLKSRTSAYYSEGVTLTDKTTRWYGFGRDMDPPSRDQTTGVILGLAATYKLVTDKDVKTRARRLILDHISYLVANNWHIITPAGQIDKLNLRTPCQFKDTFIHMVHMRLALLSVAKLVDVDGETELGALYDEAAAGVSELSWFGIWLDAMQPTDTHYFKFNLHHAHLLMLLFLGSDPNAADAGKYRHALTMLRNIVGNHRNAYFNLIWILGHPDGERAARLDDPVPYSDMLPASLSVREETLLLLRQWLRRRELLGGQVLQKTPNPTYLLSLSGDLVKDFNVLGTNIPFMSTFALPAHARPGASADFLWQRSGFLTSLISAPVLPPSAKPCPDQTSGGRIVNMGCCDTVSPGVDYLLPFWMAAYLRIIPLDSPEQPPAPAPVRRLIDPLDDGAQRARTRVVFPNAPDLPEDQDGERAAVLSILQANFDNLERARKAMGDVNSFVKSFTLRHFAYKTLSDLLGTDPTQYRDRCQEFKDRCAKHGFQFGSRGDVGPDDHFDDPNQTLIEWFGSASLQDPTLMSQSCLNVLMIIAQQCQPQCDFVLFPLSQDQLAVIAMDRLFSPTQLIQIGRLYAQIGYGLPWGPAFARIGHTAAREVYLTLLQEESNQ